MLEKKNKYILRILFLLMLCLFFFPSDKVYAAWGNQSGDGGEHTASDNLISWYSDYTADTRFAEYNYHLTDGVFDNNSEMLEKMQQMAADGDQTVAPYMTINDSGEFVRSVDPEHGAEGTE